MTTKELIIGSALLLGAAFTAAVGTSSASQAQYYRHWHGHYRGLYNYYGGYGYSAPDINRGGPGPRVDGGSGMGIGAVR
jgi:hypothetical protein